MKRESIVKGLKELVEKGWTINEEDKTIKNPETGRNIKISTALSYAKDHPAYKLAKKQVGDKEEPVAQDIEEPLEPEDRLKQKLSSLDDNKLKKELENIQRDGSKISMNLSSMRNNSADIGNTYANRDFESRLGDKKLNHFYDKKQEYLNSVRQGQPEQPVPAHDEAVFMLKYEESNPGTFTPKEIKNLTKLAKETKKGRDIFNQYKEKYGVGYSRYQHSELERAAKEEAKNRGIQTENTMKITKERLREIVKEVIKEESEYQKFFKTALEKTGKSIPQMSDEEKKDFFDKIDAAWKGKGEKNEGNAFGAAVTKAKKQGEDHFEVGGKTYKVESVNEEIKVGSSVVVNYPTLKKPVIGKVKHILKSPKGLVYVLDGDKGVWDAKNVSLKESVNKATLKKGTKLRYDKNNFVVDYVVDKKYTGKDGFDKYILKVVKSNYPNKIKIGSTEEYEDSKLTGLIRNRVMKFIK